MATPSAKNIEDLSPSRALAVKVIVAAMQALDERGGELPGKEVKLEVERRVELDEWARHPYEKSGYIRWQSILHFFSIDCVKAGFLVKKNGVWYITPEGREALKLGPVGLLRAATDSYKEWRKANPTLPENGQSEDPEPDEIQQRTVTLEEVKQLAIDGINEFIASKNPRLSDEDKILLPLVPVYFIAPVE